MQILLSPSFHITFWFPFFNEQNIFLIIEFGLYLNTNLHFTHEIIGNFGVGTKYTTKIQNSEEKVC